MQEAGWNHVLLPLFLKPRHPNQRGTKEPVSDEHKSILGKHKSQPGHRDQRITDAVQQEEKAEGHRAEDENGANSAQTR